jgi:hypothetical protein
MDVRQVPKGALIALSVSGWGGQVSYATDNPQVRKLIRLCPEEFLNPVVRAKGRAYRCLDGGISLPFPVRGVRYVPEEFLPEAEKRLLEAREELSRAAQELTRSDTWAAMVAESQRVLGPEYALDKIPSPQEVRDSFRLEYTLFSIEASPFTLDGARQVQALMEDFRQQAYSTLVAELHQLLEGMARRLKEGKRFHVSTLTQMSSWLDHFPQLVAAVAGAQNASNLDEVRAIVDQAKSALAGVVPEDLKATPSLRQSIGGFMASLQERLVAATGDAVGKRSLVLD